MPAVTICSDFGAQENKVSHGFHCFPIYLPWSERDQMPWSSFFECWVWSQLFHSPLSLLSRGSLGAEGRNKPIFFPFPTPPPLEQMTGPTAGRTWAWTVHWVTKFLQKCIKYKESMIFLLITLPLWTRFYFLLTTLLSFIWLHQLSPLPSTAQAPIPVKLIEPTFGLCISWLRSQPFSFSINLSKDFRFGLQWKCFQL